MVVDVLHPGKASIPKTEIKVASPGKGAISKSFIQKEVSALEYINWIKGQCSQDIRPKFFDSVTRTYMLLDTGAMLSCVAKQKGDKIDKNLTLRTADGKPMHTYGTREINIRLGRKSYTIKAIITDVKQTIIGMDLINHYKLGFEWFDEDL